MLLAPSVAGWGYYFSHGVALINTRTSAFGGSSAVQLTKVSLLEGMRELSKFPGQQWTVTGGHSLPSYLWGLLIIPAAAVLISAYIVFRNREHHDSPLVFSLKMAACYAFLLFVLANLYAFRMISVDVAPGFAGLSRVDMSASPAFFSILIFGLVIGFIFSLAGSYLSLRRAPRQAEQQVIQEGE
jgi:hypothetical protein